MDIRTINKFMGKDVILTDKFGYASKVRLDKRDRSYVEFSWLATSPRTERCLGKLHREDINHLELWSKAND